MNRSICIFPILFTASLLVLTFPSFEMHYLAWVALVPLFLLIRTSGPRTAFLCSWSTGFLFYIGMLWWTLRIGGMNIFNFFFMNLGIAWHFGAFGICAYFFQERFARWCALTFPAVWVILEYLRTHAGFVTVPFGVVGYSQSKVLPIAGISTFAGVYGVSFLLVAVNSVLAEITLFFYSRRYPERLPASRSYGNIRVSSGVFAAAMALFSVSLFHGAVHRNGKEGNLPLLKVALIQGKTFLDEKDVPYHERFEKNLTKYSALTRGVIDSRPDLVIWPSSSVPGRIPFDVMLVRLLSDLARETRAFFLIGTAGLDKLAGAQKQMNRIANSAFLFSPGGEIVGRYDKVHLLPFDEYIPLRGYMKWPTWIVSSDLVDYQPGKGMTVFRAGNVTFSTPICSENLLPEFFRDMSARGVDFMVSMTNEGFAKSETGHSQLLAMNVFRAIENRISIARIDTTGISCIIEPDGRVSARVQEPPGSDGNVEGRLVGNISLSRNRTFYTRHGDVFVFLLSGLLMLFISVGKLSEYKSVLAGNLPLQRGLAKQ